MQLASQMLAIISSALVLAVLLSAGLAVRSAEDRIRKIRSIMGPARKRYWAGEIDLQQLEALAKKHGRTVHSGTFRAADLVTEEIELAVIRTARPTLKPAFILGVAASLAGLASAVCALLA